VFVLTGLASLSNNRGDHARSMAWLAEAKALSDRVPAGDRSTVLGATLMLLGGTLRALGDRNAAVGILNEGLDQFRAADFALGELHVLADLGEVSRDLGEVAGSLGFYQEALALAFAYRQTFATVSCLEGIATICAEIGESERAIRLLAAAQRLRGDTGVVQRVPIEEEAIERVKTAARALLGEEAFGAASAAGTSLPVAEAVAEALAIRADERRATDGRVTGKGLTAREREILPLLVAGLTDREIADGLSIGRRTVEGHVSRLLAKLGAPTRTAAARAAVAMGMIDAADLVSGGDGG
jgi:DNA-binding NarL/FixJ family response regulator